MALLLACTAKADDHRIVQRFADWEVVCENTDTKPKIANGRQISEMSNCRAVQRLMVAEAGQTVFVLTVVRDEESNHVAVVSVPLGGYIAPGIELRIDKGKPFKLLVETCTLAGCHAGFALAGRIEKEVRSGKNASFRVWTAKGKFSDVDVSLAGLSDALADLKRRS